MPVESRTVKRQRRVSLDLTPKGLEVWKITQPAIEAARPVWKFESMRFIFHNGMAK